MRTRVAVALSGGIDSLVAAWLLKSQRHEVFGIHFLSGYESGDTARRLAQLKRMASQLAIELHVVDLSQPFSDQVVAPFVAEYGRGLTPNPCMRCNPDIKFGHLLRHAQELGAEQLATGHYARLSHTDSGNVRLERAADHVKDQSYFLARLTPLQLQKALFPLCQLCKSQVRRLAVERGLQPVQSHESQDVCFIRQRGYADFLLEQPGFEPWPGPIVDQAGRLLGTHPGLFRYTVGQRRGMRLASSEPYYVVRLEPETNRLVVGRRDELGCLSCRVQEVRWHQAPPQQPMVVSVRVRYRGAPAQATVVAEGHGAARIVFAQPQRAVTPGQGAVFYDGERVAGTGWIAAP